MILGFDNFKAALSAHKIQQQQKNTTDFENNHSYHHTAKQSPSSPSQTRDEPGPGPGPNQLAKILKDFDDNSNSGKDSDEDTHSEDEKKTFPAIGGANILVNFDSDGDESIQESENEGYGEEGDTTGDDSMGKVRRRGERYTELDFDFLDEEWLQPLNESESSEDYSDTD